MSASNCRVVSRGSQCPELDVAAACQSCFFNGEDTICDGYTVLTCQMPPEYDSTSFDFETPWIFMTGDVSGFDDLMVGTNVKFSSNRDFQVSAVPFSPGQYVNNFTFTSSASVTSLNWTWVTAAEYMYFNYPNMTIAQQPFAFPTYRPTFMPVTDDNSFDDDDNSIGQCPPSPCPTDCPNGYTTSYSNGNGCTVYCKSMPEDGQCLPNGSGCTSSCRSISIGAIVGIVVGGIAFIVLASVGGYCYWQRTRKPMTQRENEMNSA
jgi:hypothetical protein